MARYDQSSGGRFATADPLGMKAASARNPMSWNRMGYSHGDPINRFDPTGTITCGSQFVDNGNASFSVTVDDCLGDPTQVGGSSSATGGFGCALADQSAKEDDGTTTDEEPDDCTGVASSSTGGTSAESWLTAWNSYDALGVAVAYRGLEQLVNGANLNSPDCQKDMAGISSSITAQGIEKIAGIIYDNSWLYDGATSNTALPGGTPSGDNPSKDGTIGGLFQANSGLDGLTLSTGYAIWVRSAAVSEMASYSQSNGFALVLHEILHKFTTDAASAARLDSFDLGQLGRDCFH